MPLPNAHPSLIPSTASTGVNGCFRNGIFFQFCSLDIDFGAGQSVIAFGVQL